MLKKISHNKIDKKKYTFCLQNASNYRIYAEFWYLDCLTNEYWDCLVLNDYEAIMPIPFKSYFGIKVVTQPIFCQQLGIFLKENLSKELVELFLNAFNKYFVRNYNFNEENTKNYKIEGLNRTNFTLDLNQKYEELYEIYIKGRKTDLKLSAKLHLKLEENYNEKIIFNLFNSNYFQLSQSINQDYFKKIMRCCNQNNALKQINVYLEDEIIATSLFLISKNRIINFFQARKKEVEKNGSTTLIIDYIIKKYSNQDLILDFEGSNIEGIASFFKSFGSELNHYKSVGFSVK